MSREPKSTLRPGVVGTVNTGPYKHWPAVVREVQGELVQVEIVLTSAIFQLEATSLKPHDFELEFGQAERMLLASIRGESPLLEPAPDPPAQPEPVLRRSTLVDGIRLAHLVHAMAAARWTDSTADDRLWIEAATKVYYSHDGCGSFASIAWNESDLVVSLFDHESDRSPFNDVDPPEPMTRLRGLPPALETLAQASFYPLVMAGGGRRVPMVTAAAWSCGEKLASDDSWPEFIRHGGHLINLLLRPAERAMRGPFGWQVNSLLTEPQANLALELLTSPNRELGASDRATFLAQVDSEKGERCCRKVLRQLGLGWNGA